MRLGRGGPRQGCPAAPAPGPRRPQGSAFAARALAVLAGPVGDACGGRQSVPELSSAAAALRGARTVD